jgi:hypothetical protein
VRLTVKRPQDKAAAELVPAAGKPPASAPTATVAKKA